MYEITNLNLKGISVCGICKITLAQLDCLFCKEYYCKLCYDNQHFFEKHPCFYLPKQKTEDELEDESGIWEEYNVLNIQEILRLKTL